MTSAGGVRFGSGHLATRSRVPAVLRVPRAVQLGLGAVAGLAYVALVAGHSGQLAVSMFAMLGLAVLAPSAGLVALAFVLPLAEPEVLSPPGIVAMLVGATGIGILIRVPFQRPAIRVSPGILLVAGYLLLAAVSLVPAITGYPIHEVTSATLEFIHLASGIGVFLVAVYLLRTVPSWPILAITGAMAVLAAVVAIADFAGVSPVLGLVGGLVPPSEESRAVGLFSNSNYFGFFSAQVLILLVATLSVVRPAGRILVGIAIATVTMGLVLTFSRGGLLGAGTGLLVLLALRRPRAALILLGVAVVAVVVLYPVFLALRLDVSAGSTDLAAYIDQQRSEHWREQALGAGIQMFLSAPIFGLGFGMFQFLSPPYIGYSPATYSHDQWLDLVAEQGLVGLGFMIAILTSTTVALRRSTHPLRYGALAMLAAYAVESLFINSLTSIQISGPIFLVLALVLARAPDDDATWRRA
jgi:O-antigen ligase